MMAEEILTKYFIHKCYSIRNEAGEYKVKLVNSVEDIEWFRDRGVDVHIKSSAFLTDLEDDHLYVWCEKGHVSRIKIASLVDIIENGCPFCMDKYGYDWQRYIDYSFSFNNINSVSKLLPKTFGKLKNIKFYSDGHYINSGLIDVNKINSNYEYIRYKKNRVAENVVEIAWRGIEENKEIEGRLIPYVGNNKLISTYKPKEDDYFITKCPTCRKVRLYSALDLDYNDIKCEKCDTIIREQKKIFNYSYGKYERHVWTGWFDQIIGINPEYGKTFGDIQRHLNQ